MRTINIHTYYSAPKPNSGKMYTLRSTGRTIRMDGNDYQVVAWDIRHAIRQVRRYVSRGYGLRLVSVTRC